MMSETSPLLSTSPRERAGFLSPLDLVLILLALLGNLLLAALETTIAASTQSSVGASYRSSENIAWVATSYLLVATAIQPLYGRASDIFGRTRVYLFVLLSFALGCLGCGLSRNLGEMIVARAFSGIGGGGLITISQVCAWDLIPVRYRPIYQAANNLTYGLGCALGATLGGFLADTIGWRWAYLFPVPIALLSTVIFVTRARPKLQELHSELKHQGEGKVGGDVDWLGSVLLLIAITLLMLVINLGGSLIPWTSPFIPILLLSFMSLSVLFYRHEKRATLPVLPVKLINSRYMISQIGLNLFGCVAVSGALYSIPLYFQTTLLTSAAVASRRLLYPTLIAPVGSILTGLYLHRYPTRARWCQRAGAILIIVGTLLMFLLALENNKVRKEGWFALHLIWVHAGMGLLFLSSILDILAVAGDDHATATSLVFTLRLIGTVLGVSGSQAVFQGVLLGQLQGKFSNPTTIQHIRQSVKYLASLPEPMREIAIECHRRAFQATFASLAGVGLCVFLNVLLGIRSR